jgi:RoxA-like, cytochrome c-like
MHIALLRLTVLLMALVVLATNVGCPPTTPATKSANPPTDSSRPVEMLRSVKWHVPLVALREQGWSDSDAEWAYNFSQGSQLVPYSWMLHLKTANGAQRFIDTMPKYGYIPRFRTLDNEDGLCVGFCKEHGSGRDWFSMNCFACHTNIVESGGKAYLVDGAPALTDIQSFLGDLVASLDVALSNEERFAEFAKAVLGTKESADERNSLKQELKLAAVIRREYNARNMPPAGAPAFGFGRVDAIGAILNEVTEHYLEIPENHKVCNAPVSYPFLWDTPHHNKVEWNGSAPNTIFDLGNLARNTGEVIGVFGDLTIPIEAPRAGYRSSVKFDNLIEIEKKLKRLKSPLWPSGIERNTNSAVLASGAKHFQRLCAECHKFQKGDRADDDRKIVAKMDDVGTDPTMARNFRTRVAKTGRLHKSKINFNPIGGEFDQEADGATILIHTVVGTMLGGWKDAPPDQLERLKVKSLESKAFVSDDLYKGRPLNGIWATGPFLHNGSVPTLRDLLKPAKDRPSTFWVGSRKFNDKDVGFSSETGVGSLYDTKLDGNSNAGHEYGILEKEEDGDPKTLKPDEVDELLEYLKSL